MTATAAHSMTDHIETAQHLERAMHATLMASPEQQARRRAAAKQERACNQWRRTEDKCRALAERIEATRKILADLQEQLQDADCANSIAKSEYDAARAASTAATGAWLHSDAYAQWRMADRHLMALRQQTS